MRVLKHLVCTIGLLIVGMLVGCQQEQPYTEEGKATLRLQLNVPALSIEQRSVSSHPTDPNTWTSWERAVDGRYLYRVTAILLQGNRMLECKDLSLTGEPTEAILEFGGNYTHGTYRLMVVANYSAHQANDGNNGTKSYTGLSDFTNLMNTIIPMNNVDNFNTKYGQVINYQILSHNGICEKVPQPLTLVKDIELHPGLNEVSGELLRTYSRMRIVVENHSEEVLKVSSLKFSNLFTQKKAFLFAPYGYVNDKTTLKVNSEYALTPFTATTSAPLEIEAGGNAVVFDAYILESQKGANEEDYQYTLGLNYEGMNSSYTLKSNTAITNVLGIDTGYYLIYNTKRKRYFTQSNDNKVISGELGSLTTGMALDAKYVWTLEKVSNNTYFIGTSEGLKENQTAYYWNQLSNNGITLGPLKNVSCNLNSSNNYVLIKIGDNYVKVDRSYNIKSEKNNNGDDIRFYFYPVEAPAASEAVVPLKTIDEQTGQAVLVDEIKRNDFINAVVTVSYSKNKGHFTFEVKNWQTGGGDVSFN